MLQCYCDIYELFQYMEISFLFLHYILGMPECVMHFLWLPPEDLPVMCISDEYFKVFHKEKESGPICVQIAEGSVFNKLKVTSVTTSHPHFCM